MRIHKSTNRPEKYTAPLFSKLQIGDNAFLLIVIVLGKCIMFTPFILHVYTMTSWITIAGMSENINSNMPNINVILIEQLDKASLICECMTTGVRVTYSTLNFICKAHTCSN